MVHQGDFGGNLAHPSNPLGHFTASFPTPATIGAQGIQAPFEANGSEPFGDARFPWSGHPGANELVPPAVPQTFQPESHPHRCWTMPEAGVLSGSPFQHFGGAAVQPLPHGEELAARVAATNINILASQPFQPNNYTHVWPPPQQQQAPPAPRYPALRPVGPGDGTVWGVPLPPPQDAHFHQWPTVDMAPNGSGSASPALWRHGLGAMPHPVWPTSWAPPVQQPGGQTMSWAAPAQQQHGGEPSWAPQEQRPGLPAAPPASGSAQAHAPVTGKTFEELVMEAGIVDDMLVDDLIDDLLGPEAVRGGPVVSLGGGGGLPPPPPGAAGSSSGRSRDQVCPRMVRAWEEEEEEEPVGSAVSGCGRDREAAAEARARRGRRMAKRKQAIARARPGN
ncbi:trithorax group protein osa-like [Panicum miliaceum]|uniref:Trithorax group protein osa-like n=1 Tax=Panicum miliaceum TaxID=4540 RepID=A0A3L6QTY2_PANMI|nr:trithorax group protein osa-like [Panicum miliaceum]